MAGASAKNVDFSNVKERGNFSPAQVEAGDYLATITKVEDAETKETKEFQYLFTIKLKKFSQNSYPYYCKLTENQLWKLRNLLIAAGISVPKTKSKVDPNRVVGKTIGVTMEDDEYDGKIKSVVAAVFPAAELGDGPSDDDDEDEDNYDEPDTDEVEDEEEEEVSDELDGLDRLELRKILKQLKPDLTTSKSMTDDDIRDLIRDARADAEPADDEEEEDEPEPPKKAKAKPAAKPAAKTKKKSSDISDEELEELDIDDL